ncbi:MAG TPA: hypothetical protein PK317_04415 [Coprothermobacter proteolyticus]|nr:hypothetical protein [Coprothermobacter proteolyticus]
MPRQSKLGDIGIGTCCCHTTCVNYTTVFVTGADSVTTNLPASAIIGTVGIASCGHPTVALTAELLVTKENKGSHRIGDTGANCGPYVTVTGSDDVEVV